MELTEVWTNATEKERLLPSGPRTAPMNPSPSDASSPPGSTRGAVVAIVAGAIVLGGLGFAAHLSRLADPAAEGQPPGLRGQPVTETISRPDFVLPDTDGAPFDFREETEGKLALLFFGYTHCPDACPVHLANLAAVLDDLSFTDRHRVRVVFVTTDPARDDPRRIRTWLGRFDRRFTGLRGRVEDVDRILSGLGLPSVAAGVPDADGEYVVGHAAQVLAFTPDGLLRATYPFGTRQTDWAHDLPRLLHVNPDEASGDPSAER